MQILFIELLGGIGDVLMALPAIEALARSHPHASITVLTFTPGGELLHYCGIDEVVLAKRGEVRQAVEQILTRSFDLIVSDTNYESIPDLIKESRTKRVVTNLWRSPPSNQRVGDRFLQILLEEGLIAPEAILVKKPLIEFTNAEKTKAAQALCAAYRPLIFLIPDAGMPIKRWRTENWIELGKNLQHQYGGTIIVPVGGDRSSAEQIVKELGSSARIWQRGALRELAAVIAKADLVVAADTGLSHIAAALTVPTITLFGPSWHERYGQPEPHINLQGYPECPERNSSNFTKQSCWYSGVCPFDWNTCTEAISPEAVAASAVKLLDGGQEEIDRLDAAFIPDDFSEWSSVRRILVMRLDNIGDVIMTSPALRAIKENLPQAKLTLMASPGGALTAPLLPWVDDVLPWRVLWQDLGRLDFDPAREWELINTLAARQFDAAIIFTSFSQSPHPPALVCYLAGIPLRLGESKESGLGILTHEISPAPDDIHQVERNLRLIESVGFYVRDRRLGLTIQNSEGFIGGEPANGRSPKFKIQNSYILLNPWTSCQSRNYDAMRFAAAARKLSQITGGQVVVTGIEKDRDRARPLLEFLGDCAIDLIGKTSLSELATLIADARLVLTNNTSTMHIADATNTPAVVMFAGTELECQWQPRFAPVKLLRCPTVCSPCYAFTCPYELECLDISPEAVVAAGLELLNDVRL